MKLNLFNGGISTTSKHLMRPNEGVVCDNIDLSSGVIRPMIDHIKIGSISDNSMYANIFKSWYYAQPAKWWCTRFKSALIGTMGVNLTTPLQILNSNTNQWSPLIIPKLDSIPLVCGMGVATPMNNTPTSGTTDSTTDDSYLDECLVEVIDINVVVSDDGSKVVVENEILTYQFQIREVSVCAITPTVWEFPAISSPTAIDTIKEYNFNSATDVELLIAVDLRTAGNIVTVTNGADEVIITLELEVNTTVVVPGSTVRIHTHIPSGYSGTFHSTIDIKPIYIDTVSVYKTSRLPITVDSSTGKVSAVINVSTIDFLTLNKDRVSTLEMTTMYNDVRVIVDSCIIEVGMVTLVDSMDNYNTLPTVDVTTKTIGNLEDGRFTYAFTRYHIDTGYESPPVISNEVHGFKGGAIIISGFNDLDKYWYSYNPNTGEYGYDNNSGYDGSGEDTNEVIRVYRIGGVIADWVLVTELKYNEAYIDGTHSNDLGTEVLKTIDNLEWFWATYVAYNNAVIFCVDRDKPNVLRFSDVNMEWSWNQFSHIRLPDDITAICTAQDGVVVCTATATYLVIGSSRDDMSMICISSSVGCVAHTTMHSYLQSTVWVGRDGIYQLRGTNIRSLTRDKLPDFRPNVFDIYDEAQYIWYSDIYTKIQPPSIEYAVIMSDEYWVMCKEHFLVYNFLTNTFKRVYNIEVSDYYPNVRLGNIIYNYDVGRAFDYVSYRSSNGYTRYTADKLLIPNTDTASRMDALYTSPKLIDNLYTNHKLYNNIFIRFYGTIFLYVLIDDEYAITDSYTKDKTDSVPLEILIPSRLQRGYSIQFVIITVGDSEVTEIEYNVLPKQGDF